MVHATYTHLNITTPLYKLFAKSTMFHKEIDNKSQLSYHLIKLMKADLVQTTQAR